MSVSRWPAVLGVISIVLGAGGSLNGCFQLGFLALMPFLMDLAEAASQGAAVSTETIDAAQRFMPWTIALNAGSFVVAVMLLVAGIGLLRRRRYGVRWSVIWAWARLAIVLPQAWLGYVSSQAQFAAMSVQPGPGPVPPVFGLMTGMALVFVVLYAIWSASYPVFTLIWMHRGAVKHETMTWA
ncbi:MAG: hypothetical protein C4547_05800 [Phycisphaerales bacterium]|nr:MAG: hypothetical protein C4547_05800 [Phycisphaerales bacterium]